MNGTRIVLKQTDETASWCVVFKKHQEVRGDGWLSVVFCSGAEGRAVFKGPKPEGTHVDVGLKGGKKKKKGS